MYAGSITQWNVSIAAVDVIITTNYAIVASTSTVLYVYDARNISDVRLIHINVITSEFYVIASCAGATWQVQR